MIESAAKLALRKAQPGTQAFRVAMRDGLEQTGDLGTTTLHFAFSSRTTAGSAAQQVLAVVKDGKWVLVD